MGRLVLALDAPHSVASAGSPRGRFMGWFCFGGGVGTSRRFGLERIAGKDHQADLDLIAFFLQPNTLGTPAQLLS